MATKQRASIGFIVALAACVGTVRGQGTDPNADGKIVPEIQLILTDVNPADGVPDILELPSGKRRPGFVGDSFLPAVDGCYQHVTFPDWDGFTDEPIDVTAWPEFDCKDGTSRARVPTNHGKITVIYLADSDGYINPADPENTDDSLLYLGMDICNALPLQVTGDLGSWRTDYQLHPTVPSLCEYGLPSTEDDPNCLTNFMVPFDADGDGDPSAATRLPALPENSFEMYGFGLFACAGTPIPCIAEPDGSHIIDLALVANRPVSAYLVDPNVRLLVDGDPADPNQILGYPQWPHDGTTMAQIKQWGVDAFDSARRCPGNGSMAEPEPPTSGWVDPDLAKLDVEFIVPRIDTLVDEKFPTPYWIDRLRIAKGLLQTRSDANSDQ